MSEVVLVTGASGFLGGHLVEWLAKDSNINIRILARPTSDLSHLQLLIDAKRIQVIQGSLTDEESLRKAVQGVHIIYHCAALSSDWGKPEDFIAANIRGVELLTKLAKQQPTMHRFLHVSTTDTYGYPRSGLGDESTPLTDVGLPYNHSKIEGEKIVRKLGNDLPYTIIRPCNIYGPRSIDFISEILEAISEGVCPLVAGGTHPAGLVYIDHVCQAIITAANSPNTVGQAYHLVDEPNISWKTYFDALAVEAGLRKPWLRLPFTLSYCVGWLMEFFYRLLGKYNTRPLLTRHAVLLLGITASCDTSAARRDLGYKETVTFEEGIKNSVAWWKCTQASKKHK